MASKSKICSKEAHEMRKALRGRKVSAMFLRLLSAKGIAPSIQKYRNESETTVGMKCKAIVVRESDEEKARNLFHLLS